MIHLNPGNMPWDTWGDWWASFLLTGASRYLFNLSWFLALGLLLILWGRLQNPAAQTIGWSAVCVAGVLATGKLFS